MSHTSSLFSLCLDSRQHALGRYVLHRLRQVLGQARGDGTTWHIRQCLVRAQCLEPLRPLSAVPAETLGGETLECLNTLLHDVQHTPLTWFQIQERMLQLQVAMMSQAIRMSRVIEALQPSPCLIQ